MAFIAGFLFKFQISGNQYRLKQDSKRQKKTAGSPAVFGDLLRFFRLREYLSTAGGA
ncbi:hypothetical protein [Polaromonas jejuensis]|uniref:hypothetical protein n=1 Tax=Polaromonas jejuensis TaxID=457502 RepID=UPI0012EE4286|nr:hypothetical protein [Polaromonas jejuensis]